MNFTPASFTLGYNFKIQPEEELVSSSELSFLKEKYIEVASVRDLKKQLAERIQKLIPPAEQKKKKK